MTREDREFLEGADADVSETIETTLLDEFLDDAVRRDQSRSARALGQRLCPGTWDAHESLDDEACPYCGAAL